jgi:diguanylate cyclase (GGDEF)-like protein
VLRAIAVVDVATATTDPESLTRSFGDTSSACVIDADGSRCTDVDLSATSSFGDGARASVEVDGPAVVVDDTTGSLLVVDRGEITTVLLLPADALIGPVADAAIEQYGAVVDIVLSPSGAKTLRVGPTPIDGAIVVTDTLPLPGDGGSVRVTAAVPNEVGLFGEGLSRYLVLIGLGTVLLALAGWTFLIDRRTLERRATTDDLTGLPNRREFERLTDEALLAAERFNTGACVMLIDLNGFKQINDTLGHQFGDLVLRAAAKRLSEAIRGTDVVGRWGGDEFVILLPGIQDGSAVRSSAERIGALLGGTPIADDVTVTAAIGAALYPRHGTTLDDLIRAADLAMYGAKSTGVTHRLADSMHGGFADDDDARRHEYDGPDRRRSHSKDSDRV